MQLQNRALALAFVLLADLVVGLSVAIAAPPSAPTAPDIDSLVVWWALDEAGGTREDAHDGDHDLTDNNTTGSNSGLVGDSAYFDDTNSEYLSRSSDDAELQFNADFTVVFWMRPERNATEYLISHQTGAVGWAYRRDSATSCLIAVNNNSLLSSATCGSANEWAMVAVYYRDDTDKWGHSINGGAFTESAGAAVPDVVATLEIAKLATTYYRGRIDELSVWSSRLSNDEVSWLYNDGAGRAYSDVAEPTPTPTETLTPSETPTGTLTPTATLTATAISIVLPTAIPNYLISTVPASGNVYTILREVSFGDLSTAALLLVLVVINVIIVLLQLRFRPRQQVQITRQDND